MSREDNERRRQADKRATIEQARHLIENVNSQLAQRRRRANGALATVFGDR